jgi:hypothetical protein
MMEPLLIGAFFLGAGVLFSLIQTYNDQLASAKTHGMEQLHLIAQ